MKIVTLALVLVCIHASVAEEEYKIPENIDLQEILKNDRLTKNYVKCVLGSGKCTPEGEKLAKAIPEALENKCAKCTDTLKEDIKKVIHHLIDNLPEEWKQLEEKFDPKGEYRQKYKELIEKEGIKA